MKFLALLSLAVAVQATPCPYGQLAERGALSAEDTAKFFAARAEKESAVEAEMEKVKRETHARQEAHYKRQLSTGKLTLGGGLLGGVLQPFSGILEKLDVPVLVSFLLMVLLC